MSLLIEGYPTADVPVALAQGPAVQGMFLELLGAVDPAVMQRLHADSRYRPYTLSPLSIHEALVLAEPPSRHLLPDDFHAFRWARDQQIPQGTLCALRVTLLEDALFPTFGAYFLQRAEPTFSLGQVTFTVTNVLATSDSGSPWSRYTPYNELIMRAITAAPPRQIGLRFLTPTSFSKGDVDLPLPLPRLVFQSYLHRFQEFGQFAFAPDLLEQIDRYTGIARLNHLRTDTIKTKKVMLTGFTGEVWFEIGKSAPEEVARQMNLLAEFAYFCGTGKKTTVGMGQTVTINN